MGLSQVLLMENPFFKASPLPLEAPDFSAIRVEHFLPAFEAGMAQQKDQILAIANNGDEPDFENTIVAMERSGEILNRIQAVFSNLSSAHTSPEIQKIEMEVAPALAAHSDDIYLNRSLFERVEKLHARRDSLKLDDEQRRLLDETYRQFVRAGARLDEARQQKIREINEAMSRATTQFHENLLAITKERSVVVDDRARLDGLGDAEIAAASRAATEAGHEGKYLLPIVNTTRQPVLIQLRDRELRRRVWEASAFRGLGREGGIDNRELVRDLARLRAEKSRLLGFESHAAWALDTQMAKTPAAARKMLAELVPAVRQRAEVEAADIKAKMKDDGIEDEVQPWDWDYYAEKVRQERYGIDDAEVRNYLELDSVLKNGVFYTMNRLFGIRFVERNDLPTYHPDVRVFDVIDDDGSQLGLFYADYYARPNKRGGAWMSSFVEQSHLLGKKPVIVNVMNIPKPADGDPVLISFDHATTMLHEMGHAVHGLFSSVNYPTLAGTSVPRDFVEFPSTFQEDWAVCPEVLANYARHHVTGEVLPDSLLGQIVAARSFNQGFDTLEYLSAALLDLKWHALAPEEIPGDVEAFEAEALKEFGVDLSAVPPRYRSAYFAHIWPGGYAASYYAYMWSEVLAADSFDRIRRNGGLTTANGKRFRDAVLSRGGSREPEQLYLDFTGAPPAVEGLLVRRGLKQAPAGHSS